MRAQPAPDLAIAAIAARQQGVVAHDQLRELDLSRQAIGRRVRAGKLHVLHRGVYAVGHRRVSTEGRWWAAVLAGGRGALLSHASAAAAWDLQRASGIAHVSVPG